MLTSKFKRTALATSLGLALVGAAAMVRLPSQAETQSMIVQGHDLATVRSAVEAVGGEITHELGIINAVGAKIDAAQIGTLRHHGDVSRIMADSDSSSPYMNSIEVG